MLLENGGSLSHYRLVERVGEGGMSVVWTALDTRLERTVALKFLHSSLTKDENWLARFRHEARLVAALNHPGIVTIHAIEEMEGGVFLAMEFVEGKTLDRVIPKGGFALPRLLRLASDIADAVAAAHGRGVTQRGLTGPGSRGASTRPISCSGSVPTTRHSSPSRSRPLAAKRASWR